MTKFIPPLFSIIFSSLVFALAFCMTSNAQTTRGSDTGYFQDNIRSATADPQIMLVPSNGSPDTEVCSYTPSGTKTPPSGGLIGKDCFRFQADSSNPKPGYMVISIHDSGHFHNLGPDQFDAPSRSSYANVWQYTELKTAWFLYPPGQNDVESFSERRNCTISPPTHTTAHGLIDAWPSGCDNTFDTRSQSCGFSSWRPWRQNPSSLLTSQETSRSRDPATNDPWGVCGPTTESTCGTVPDVVNGVTIYCTDPSPPGPDPLCTEASTDKSNWSPPDPLSPGQTSFLTVTTTYNEGPPICPDYTTTKIRTRPQTGTWQGYVLENGCSSNDNSIQGQSCTTDQGPQNLCHREHRGTTEVWEYICIAN